MGRARFKLLLAVLYALTALAVAYFLISGYSYYRTPIGLRARHVDYWRLKPGGPVGNTLGITGSAMMLLLLVYSFRKRAKRFRGRGKLSRWLDVHIWLGVTGPLLVVLHSSFKVQGIAAVSFWAMVAVAASGVLGRYLYVQIPRNRVGDEVSLAELEQRDKELLQQLRAHGVSEEALNRLERITTPSAPGSPGPTLLARIFLDDLTIGIRVRAVLRGAELPAPVRRTLARLAVRRAILRRRIALWGRMQRLFYYWHVIHKPFAVVMYLFMAVHVTVAIITGYGFGFSG